jgi:pyruvate/2-oxoglutarate dehydrogenase complex dihydrolipoamide dehydrogenase (E3) component
VAKADGKLPVYEGHARFESARLVSIGSQTITVDQIFINVGGRALVPPMPDSSTSRISRTAR